MKKLYVLIVSLLCMTTNCTARTKTVRLKIVETSDVHGHFFPYDFINQKPIDGTLVRVSTHVEKLRKEYGERLLLLDNGDILQGQPTCYWSNYVRNDQENIAAKVINYMRYDVECVGNHDIEPGHAVYDKWIREVHCPFICANMINKETGKPYVQPYATFLRDGVKICVISMLTPAIPNWLNEYIWEGLKFQEMTSCARYWVEYVKKHEQPDLICGLFHSGLNGGIVTPEYEEDATEHVARAVPGFDIIFFGHDHQEHCLWVKNSQGDDVLLLDPSCNARKVAEADVEFTLKKGKVVSKNIMGRLVDVRNEQVDSSMMTHFKEEQDAIKQYVGRTIGTFDKTIYTRDCFFGSAPFTDLIHNLQLELTGADISFNAPLAFDACIKEGPVKVSDMFNLYKFENLLFVLNMTGEEIHKHLEMSYALWTNTMKSPDDHIMLLNDNSKGDMQRYGFKNFTFNFDGAAGIDYEVDVTKPVGQKVHILQMSDGRPFDYQQVYKVVMNSYRANGGGELLIRGAGIPKEELQNRVVYQSELDTRHYLMEMIEKKKLISPKANNNWKFVPEEWTQPAIERDRKLIFGN